jgi:hypothetical protein
MSRVRMSIFLDNEGEPYTLASVEADDDTDPADPDLIEAIQHVSRFNAKQTRANGEPALASFGRR